MCFGHVVQGAHLETLVPLLAALVAELRKVEGALGCGLALDVDSLLRWLVSLIPLFSVNIEVVTLSV